MNIYLETLFGLPTFLTLFIFFIFGTIIGSFLNVVILRKQDDAKVSGRSKCPKCQKQLKWADMIPILSWLVLRGKCRKCAKPISVQYPLVEAGTGLIFAAIFWRVVSVGFDPAVTLAVFVFNAIVFSLLIAIFVYDLKHKIIPDVWSFSFAGLALAQAIWVNWEGFSWSAYSGEAWLNLFAGLIFFFPFWAIWYLSRGRWIGLGDGKLVLGIGWYLGFVFGLSAIALAFWIGAAFALFLMLMDRLNVGGRNITMKTEIPFGPFLILGLAIQFFAPADVIGLSIFLL
jgi:leader peptidase (prepilin peptidase)/N-methyltransferase